MNQINSVISNDIPLVYLMCSEHKYCIQQVQLQPMSLKDAVVYVAIQKV
jgi:hypothetical protein